MGQSAFNIIHFRNHTSVVCITVSCTQALSSSMFMVKKLLFLKTEFPLKTVKVNCLPNVCLNHESDQVSVMVPYQNFPIEYFYCKSKAAERYSCR